MMFAVYSFVMVIGAYMGSNDAITGNTLMALSFTALTLAVFRTGMHYRKKAHAVFQDVINKELAEHGCVDAHRFSEKSGVSLDDARDILHRHGAIHGWTVTELEGYNAIYRPR